MIHVDGGTPARAAGEPVPGKDALADAAPFGSRPRVGAKPVRRPSRKEGARCDDQEVLVAFLDNVEYGLLSAAHSSIRRDPADGCERHRRVFYLRADPWHGSAFCP